MSSKPREILLAGYPDFLARRVCEKILASSEDKIVLLVPSLKIKEAKQRVATYTKEFQNRIEIMEGDLSALDFGLTGKEYTKLLSRIQVVVHAALSFQMRDSKQKLFERNVRGTKNLLDFCAEGHRVKRLYFYGSIHVSGTRTGYIREAEFDKGQAFKSFIEYTYFKAEQLVRAYSHRISSTIFRIGNLVGDSKTGEMGEFDGPYAVLLAMLNKRSQKLYLPGKCNAKSHIVPIDYVVDATWHISQQPSSAGNTYHIVDPHSPEVRRIFRLVTSYLGLKPPIFGIPERLLKSAYTLLGMQKKIGVPFEVFSYFNHQVRYSTTNTTEALTGSDITCPEFESYLPIVIEYAERRIREEIERKEEQSVSDPLDSEFYMEDSRWKEGA